MESYSEIMDDNEWADRADEEMRQEPPKPIRFEVQEHQLCDYFLGG